MALDALTLPELWDDLPAADGPGRRLTLYGLNVGGYHLFVDLDSVDPRPHALVVYHVDIWPEGFPDVPTDEELPD